MSEQELNEILGEDTVYNFENVRRPYYRARGLKISEEEAFEIIRRADRYFGFLKGWAEDKDSEVAKALKETETTNNFQILMFNENHSPVPRGWCIGDAKNGCTAMITVTEGLLQSWGITKEELEKQAVENMAAEGYSAVALDKILNMEPLPESDRMYVVTNRKGYFGAAIITESELLSQFAEMLGGNVYILPSSLHEVILIPAATSHTPWSLSQIVYEVNRSGMPEEEILSDSVYYFRADTKTVEVIAEKQSQKAV